MPGIGHGIGIHLRRGAGGAAAPSFDVLSYSPLFWFDASDTDTLIKTIAGTVLAANGETVERWADKSGNAYHADQGTGSARPTRSTTALNGRNGLTFDGGDMLTASGVPAVAVPCTFYAVFRHTNAAYGYVIDDVGGDKRIILARAGTDISIYSGAFVAQGTDPATARAVCAVFGASAVLRVDGTETAGNSGTVAGVGGIVIGSHSGSSFVFGAIVEVIGFTTAHDATARAAFHSYFSAKWGTA